jgi:hypothetical protein
MAVVIAAGLLLGACGPGSIYKKNPSHADVADAQIARGDSLAARYCGSCHQLPKPDLLDAGSWEKGVLPQMGPRLGIFQYMNQRYPNNIGDPNVGRAYYPSGALMSEGDWKAIIDYYTALAPDSLPAQQRVRPLLPDTTLFRIAPAARVSPAPAATCFIRYEPRLRQVLTSDIISHTLNIWDKDLQPAGSFLVGGSIVDLASGDSAGGYFACNMGPFGPNNAPAGHIDHLPVPPRVLAAGRPLAVIEDSLLRPVNIAAADLNGDGREDLVVCEFGYIRGELAWLENKGGGRYQKHVLRSVPGAIRVVVQDYNHDGLPDLWVLFAQGDEGIFLYTNQGHGQFVEQPVLRFPPSYGSTYFELDDFDKDGNMDILYTCGDNGDFSTVLKPYHGVYIFLNDGRNHFKQQYFFPINGCYKAMARDFDGDGDLDIASIAFFADYVHQPEEGFVYLENIGNGQFSPHSVPGTECGRWITMDIADADGDGKPDILLANCSVGPAFLSSVTDWKKGPPFIILTNKTR